ncbi:MAG TPA: signal peptide peptidase SppA [Rhizomicrobium sp.]|jgi:protease-4|nr:signal peptide peptidase SppA [Rhizomicrobium sp.]
MIAFLRWMRAIALGTLNGLAKLAFFAALVVVALFVVALIEGDGLPSRMVLNLDLRSVPPDSSHAASLFFTQRTPPTMDTVLALDRAGRDSRVKGVFLQLGGGLPVAQAEEIAAALIRFRATGRFVIAYAQGFNDPGLGDYLAAASADQIWMEPKSPFGPSGTGAGAVFLRGLFDKINATPQIVKRADYKSAADMMMEKDYTAPDREETTAFLQSWYNNAVKAITTERKVDTHTVTAMLDADPQFAEDAKRARLVDQLGYDGQAKAAARKRAGLRSRIVPIGEYARATENASEVGNGPRVALIEGAGEIVDGATGRGGIGASEVMAGDDYAEAFRNAARDHRIKAILFRIDSPGGSVTASDQILEALKEAKAAGKPVIVSMGPLAASGGYYVATAADKIVAEPATLTGSIGVLTGKVAIGKSAQMIGVTLDNIGVGKNALFDSSVDPYTPEQLANLNHQADVIYADFMQKVADGRKLPIGIVQKIAKGRVWTGADALPKGLVDDLGTFWTAVGEVKALIGATPDTRLVFRRYPEKEGFFETLLQLFSGTQAGLRAMEGISVLLNRPGVQETISALNQTPHAPVELRAVNLPVQ